MEEQGASVHGLRARFGQAGDEALADHELIALLLRPGDARGSVTARGLGLLEGLGGLGGLARQAGLQADRLPGLGPVETVRLRAALELGRRAACSAPPGNEPITSSAQVADWFRIRLQDSQRESIHALLLDGRNRPLTHLCIIQGSWTTCPLDPKMVYSACLRHGAPALILIHNHPSGDPSPSRDDLQLTERLKRAGQVVGVRLIDHLIVGRHGICSLADRGLL
jgi:DNA repair protein RadC